jgi:hypothetical protein
MRHLIAGIILIALNCVVICAQDKPSSTLPTPISAQSRINNLIFSPSGQSNKQEGLFVFQDGAVYMRVPGGKFLMPVSGGGASGCFSLDLPQRIRNLKEFIPELDSLDRSRPTSHQAEAMPRWFRQQ